MTNEFVPELMELDQQENVETTSTSINSKQTFVQYILSGFKLFTNNSSVFEKNTCFILDNDYVCIMMFTIGLKLCLDILLKRTLILKIGYSSALPSLLSYFYQTTENLFVSTASTYFILFIPSFSSLM